MEHRTVHSKNRSWGRGIPDPYTPFCLLETFRTLLAAGFPDQADERDLRRNPESHRRSPIPRAAADIDPHAAEAIEPRNERLLQAHQEIPRPELPAMSVPGELKLVAGGFRGICGAGLVGEQQLRRVLGRPFRGRERIAPV